MDDSQKLLADYVKNGSESAFRELVSRYVNLVHSTALRLVDGDTHLAQDITQTVFVDLARKAHTLPPDVMLGGWLHRDACFAAGTAMRGERRRQFRERQAVAMNVPEDHAAANLALVAPILDEAINQLEPEDRAAILLRFFEQLEFRAVGERIGRNEDAARMRVTRALDKLHALLKNHGVTFSAAALGAALAAEAVTAAPLGLAASVAATALGSVAASGAAVTLLKFMTMTKLKIMIVSALAIAALAVPVVMQHHSIANLREENKTLQQQAAQLASLQAENERLSNLVVQASTASASPDNQIRELARLRNEVGLLRDQTNSLTKALKNIHQPGLGAEFGNSGKRQFRNMTMAEFAKFIAGVLHAPVADQTGLTGTYDIEMTPPRIGGDDGKLERVTGILRNELGLQLISFAGPFTEEEMQAAQSGPDPIVLRLPDDLPEGSHFVSQNPDGTFAVKLPDSTTTNVVAFTNSAASSSAANGQGFAIKLDHSAAPGLKTSTGVAEGVTAQANNLPPGVYEADSPGVPPRVANNLRLIDSSKQQWALEQRKQNTDIPTWQDLQPYLGRGQNRDMSDFTKPGVGEYAIRSVGQSPQFRGDPAAVSNFYPPADPSVSKQNACINNLRLIDAAEQQWALEYRKQTTDTPTEDDLRRYLGRGAKGEFPVCPDGGVYTIKSVGEKPTCSIPGHVLP